VYCVYYFLSLIHGNGFFPDAISGVNWGKCFCLVISVTNMKRMMNMDLESYMSMDTDTDMDTDMETNRTGKSWTWTPGMDD
jgi:hypothetical protein